MLMPLSKHTMDQWVVAESGLVLPEATVQARRKLTCIDLFAGVGGFSPGVIQVGFETVCAVDTCII